MKDSQINEQVNPVMREILNSFASVIHSLIHSLKCKCPDCKEEKADYLYHARKDEVGK